VRPMAMVDGGGTMSSPLAASAGSLLIQSDRNCRELLLKAQTLPSHRRGSRFSLTGNYSLHVTRSPIQRGWWSTCHNGTASPSPTPAIVGVAPQRSEWLALGLRGTTRLIRDNQGPRASNECQVFKSGLVAYRRTGTWRSINLGNRGPTHPCREQRGPDPRSFTAGFDLSGRGIWIRHAHHRRGRVPLGVQPITGATVSPYPGIKPLN